MRPTVPRPWPWPRCVLLCCMLLLAITAPTRGRCSEQEAWVLKQVLAGERADLQDLGQGKPRSLTARFLVDLIAAAEGGGTRGVWISNAVFEEDVDLSEVSFDRPLRLERSTFARRLDLARARFTGGLVSLDGSTVRGTLEMSGFQVSHDLVLRGQARFEGEVNLRGAKLGGSLGAEGSTFHGPLNMGGLRTGGSVLLGGATFKGDVLLVEARIDGSIDTTGSTFERVFNADAAVLGQAMIVRWAKFTSVQDRTNPDAVNATVRDAKVGSKLDARDASFAGKLDLRNVDVGNDLLLGGTQVGGDLLLLGARTGGSLFLDHATFAAVVDMGGIEVAESLKLSDATFKGEVVLDEVSVGDSLALGPNATFKGVVRALSARIGNTLEVLPSSFNAEFNLGGVEVKNSLFLRAPTVFRGPVYLVEAKVGDSVRVVGLSGGPGPVVFQDLFNASRAVIGQDLEIARSTFKQEAGEKKQNDPLLAIRDARISGTLDALGSKVDGLVDLTGTSVGQLFAQPDAPRFNLHGLTYQRLPQPEAGDMPGRSACNFTAWVDWLRRDVSGSPQPNQQMAAVLRQMGCDEPADDAIYQSRERERENADLMGSLGLWLLKWTVGYGLGAGYFWALLWIAGLTAVGALVLWSVEETRQKGPGWCIYASLDALIPVVELNKKHGEVIDSTLKGPAEIYFYLHKIAGFILGSFVVAGLAGLTQGR